MIGEPNVDEQRTGHLGAGYLEPERVQVRKIVDMPTDEQWRVVVFDRHDRRIHDTAAVPVRRGARGPAGRSRFHAACGRVTDPLAAFRERLRDFRLDSLERRY